MSRHHAATESNILLEISNHENEINKAYKSFGLRKIRTFWDSVSDFIRRGNVVDLAIGLVIGQSITAIINSFVIDIFTPIFGLGLDRDLIDSFFILRCPTTFPNCTRKTWKTIEQARQSGAVTMNWGKFIQTLLNFLVIILFVYLVIQKVFQVLFRREILSRKQCGFCLEFIKGAATKCSHCTSEQKSD